MTTSFRKYAARYWTMLLEDVVPFWERHSIDPEFGGYFTCLDREGKVFDTDKFVWLQARQVWTFSMLYNQVEPRDAWLEIAKAGADFLIRHGRDESGDWYFSLDRTGRPLVQPYSIFSNCFAAMAFCQYAAAANSDAAGEVGLQAYRNVLRRRDDPKGRYSKSVPGGRPMRSLAVPMILANLALEMEPLTGPEEMWETVKGCVSEVLGRFLDRKRGLLHENVLEDGTFDDSFEGRLMNPGHTLEAMWFLMDVGRRAGDDALIDEAAAIVLRTLDFGWDEEHGGIFYFLDSKGKPPQQLEWDQKLWWVHCEALVALLMAYELRGGDDCWAWFQRVHDYTWRRFPDAEHGEWFGYLNRRGEILLNLKGGKWKGCFHVPRALHRCALLLDRLAESAG